MWWLGSRLSLSLPPPPPSSLSSLGWLLRLLLLFRMGCQLSQHLPLPLWSWSALPPLPESALPLLVLWWSFGRLDWS